MKKILLALVIVTGLSWVAYAQQAGSPYAWPVTVGTSSAQVLPYDPLRKHVKFCNPNATALVAVAPNFNRASGSTLTAVVNGAGSVTILPYACFDVDGYPTLAQAWSAIANSPSSALTIWEFE